MHFQLLILVIIIFSLQEVEAAVKVAFNKTKHGGDFHLTNIPTRSQLIYVNILPANNGENTPPAGPASGNFHSPQGNLSLSSVQISPSKYFSFQIFEAERALHTHHSAHSQFLLSIIVHFHRITMRPNFIMNLFIGN